jgi:hypothetical protein
MFPGAQSAHPPPLDEYADNNFGLAPLPQKIEVSVKWGWSGVWVCRFGCVGVWIRVCGFR